jgi:hypothetical protein
VPDVQIDFRFAGRVSGPVSGQIPLLGGVVEGGGKVAAAWASDAVAGGENCLMSCTESMSWGARVTTSLR